ncbi:protein phosphatase 1 regulatory subunit 3A isoform X4 [Pantherophis guttatus]|uniref:Protein phosphatase 1 regulatory subunit 3A isoform X4 n=1 Tax=Pantherophis guttatus TaxID=94885 RepID=A0ABM3Z405_PANGU|nr:protein phosphatase 1 regulatory subunit 3A isoform X4 [Pantherophis guttatus]
MESFEEPGRIGRENLLEVPTLSNCFSEEEDVKATHQHRFSPGLRRRNSDSSEEMEAEIPSTIARKVSFADAFGFDLVSVKEFDSWDNPVTQLSDDLEDEDLPVEEFYLTPLFLIPTTQGELLQTVRAHKICLEFVEFLPGIICMKGIIRVLNISFQKLVYVRMSLDNWLTYYDILAEYVPNSCDGETDQFLFKISLVPPYQKEGAKVEFCIRYETSVGIFWSNNNNKNYILICHKKGTASSLEDNNLQEEVTNKHIKGCLKTTLSSKEEALTMTDKDIWINPRISDSHIPQIIYSHVDNENKYRKENEEEKNDEDDKENEKELELLLSQHLTRSRSSSTNERSSYATEPVRFPNELQQLGDKLESGLIRHPLLRSSSTEHALQDKELQNNQTYSIGNDRQLLFPEKCREVDSLKKSAQSIEGLNPNATYSSPEYWPEIKKNQTAYIPDIVSSNCGMHQTYVPSDEFRNVPGNKTKETLFIEGKIVSEQGVHCEVPWKHSEHSSQGLHNKEVEEGSIWNSFSHIGPTTEPKICRLDEKLVGSCYKNSSVIFPKGFVDPHTAEVEEMLPPPTDASTEIATQSGCNFNPKDETTHVILNINKPQEFPPSENRKGNIGQFSHQTVFSPEKQIRPTILIREPTEETEKTSLDLEGLITEKKMNIVRHDKQAFFDHTGISGQQTEAYNSPAECLVLKHIAYKILYFLLFIVFCVTLYHYDLIVCFALYLFSLCWLYCDGRRNKNSIKKE